ncbi:MAG TPA: L-histidine N(alpha)-methyltransferase [Steroidobacteraceae bacterium]|nr:L-histidine N(alpha)-methyltransferase [Steroidobacteraceae bacterium]
MKRFAAAVLSMHAAAAGYDPLLAEVFAGLTARPKYLYPKFFYDAHGSELFDRICELPEYYLTRTELSILREHAPPFVRALGPGVRLIEPGSGSSLKTRILLNSLTPPAAYVPVDISRSHLMQAARTLAAQYPRLEILPVAADFTQPFEVPQAAAPVRSTLVFFPGSTIGNFDHAEAIGLLRMMGRLAGDDGQVLVGADLRKSPATLEAAYNDSAGVTAAFNLNLLARLNREYDADFDLEAFEHRAPWVEEHSRIEMHLVSRRAQRVHIRGVEIKFEAGESIWTESCHKYDCTQFAAMADGAGLHVREVWTDEARQFSVQLLAARDKN